MYASPFLTDRLVAQHQQALRDDAQHTRLVAQAGAARPATTGTAATLPLPRSLTTLAFSLLLHPRAVTVAAVALAVITFVATSDPAAAGWSTSPG